MTSPSSDNVISSVDHWVYFVLILRISEGIPLSMYPGQPQGRPRFAMGKLTEIVTLLHTKSL